MNKTELYNRLFKAYKEAYPLKAKNIAQNETNELWLKVKNDPNVKTKVEEIINDLKCKALKVQSSLLSIRSNYA